MQGTILTVSFGFGQISDALDLDRRREPLSFPGGTRKVGCYFFLYLVSRRVLGKLGTR